MTLKDPPRRIINVPTSESNLDEDRPRYYDITTNGEDDTSSDVESESNNEKSDWNSGIESEGEEEVTLNNKKVEEEEDDDVESPINEARINRKVSQFFFFIYVVDTSFLPSPPPPCHRNLNEFVLKHIRGAKIADLEISNQSLLAVNTMLESTVRKQAKQIAELQKSRPRFDI